MFNVLGSAGPLLPWVPLLTQDRHGSEPENNGVVRFPEEAATGALRSKLVLCSETTLRSCLLEPVENCGLS